MEISTPGKRKKSKLFPIAIAAVFLSGTAAILVTWKFQPGHPETRETTPISQTNVSPTLTSLPTPTKVPTPPPVVSQPGEKIIKAELQTDCKLKVTTTKQEFSTSTGMSGGFSDKCEPRAIGKISPTGKFLAYEDVSGGIDSVMALFMLDFGKKVTLGVWGTSTIMDYVFLPDDRLAAINGYPDIFEEQWLTLFDLPNISKNYITSFSTEYDYLMPANPTFESTIQLPNSGTTHERLGFSDGKIQTKDPTGTILVQYDPDRLVLLNEAKIITPETAFKLVYQYIQKMAPKDNVTLTTTVLDATNCTNNFWAVNVVDQKTKEILRSYNVNSSTGEVTQLESVRQPVTTKTPAFQVFRDEKATFQYPGTWIAGPIHVYGSSSEREITDPAGKFVLTWSERINYNQETGKPYTSFAEYIKMENVKPFKIIQQYEAYQVLPRAGSEHINSVDFFALEKPILTLTLETMSKEPESVAAGQQLFGTILGSLMLVK